MRKVFISLGILLFLVVLTSLFIIYGRGYQINFLKGKPEVSGTGLLVATSVPDGASVYINDHLSTATNNTINLAPGTYKIKIVKEAYFPWEKTVKIEKEVVTKIEALLFSKAPKLESLTDLEVTNSLIDPSNTKIAFTVSSQSAKKNGIYIFNLNTGPLLTLQSAVTQIVDETLDKFSSAKLLWSPDGKSIIAIIGEPGFETVYELSSTGFNESPKDITATFPVVTNQFSKLIFDKERAQINTLKQDLRKVVNESFKIISWSPDETKILYVATSSATIPTIINPPLIGTNTTKEERNIEVENVYVYDIKEDKNFLILSKSSRKDDQKLLWLPDGRHLLFVHDKKIDIMEYDGINKITVFAGPFVDGFVYPWPAGGRFVIVTNLGNNDIEPTFYTVTLK